MKEQNAAFMLTTRHAQPVSVEKLTNWHLMSILGGTWDFQMWGRVGRGAKAAHFLTKTY